MLQENLQTENKKIDIYLEEKSGDLMKLLPVSMPIDKFKRIVLSQLNKSSKLRQCSSISIFDSVCSAAELGLYPSATTGHAYLVPFGNQCTLIIGYQGLIDLARRSGFYTGITCDAVYSNDEFSYTLGSNPNITHKPALKDRGELLGYYAIAYLKEGTTHPMKYLTLDEIDSFKPKIKRSASDDLWVTRTEQMRKKTVIRQMLKYSFKDSAIERAISVDYEADNVVIDGECQKTQTNIINAAEAAEVL